MSGQTVDAAEARVQEAFRLLTGALKALDKVECENFHLCHNLTQCRLQERQGLVLFVGMNKSMAAELEGAESTAPLASRKRALAELQITLLATCNRILGHEDQTGSISPALSAQQHELNE